jgi:glycosyltransferase involved in cell wall biosynthesis
MRKLAPQSKVQLLPHAIDMKEYQGGEPSAAEPSDTPTQGEVDGNVRLSFIGDLSYLPNIHALTWIRDELLPRFHAALKDSEVKIRIHSERKASPSLETQFPDYEFLPYFDTETLRRQITESEAVIFPLRYGRGNRIHILEAMASGVPVVTTGRGADGLVLKPLENICIAEDADAFVSHVMRITSDGKFRAKVVSKALQTVNSQYDWPHSVSTMEELLSRLGIAKPTLG